MALRSLLANIQHGLWVETTLLAFTPQAVVPSAYVYGDCPEGLSVSRVMIRRVFDESADAALRQELDSLLPLIPAMQPEDGNHAALLRTTLERIIERISPDEQRTFMLDGAATFATLALSNQEVRGIVTDLFKRRRYMLDLIRDFPWLRAGYE